MSYPTHLQTSEHISQVVETHNAMIRHEIRQWLAGMNPYMFEALIASLLERMGYNVQMTPRGKDLGVDIIATGRVGVTHIRDAIQVKRQRAKISRPVVDQLRGVLAMHNASKGTIITNSRFSKECYKYAKLHGQPEISLIDGEDLVDLLIKYEVGLESTTVEVHHLDYEFLSRY